MTTRHLLWVGDAVCASGFSRATHNILHHLKDTWKVTVLGLNHYGDPHSYPYDIYPAYPAGDGLGVNRLNGLCTALLPDIVVLQNDPWNMQRYLQQIPKSIPVVGVVAVDGKNIQGTQLAGLSHAIFWTRFGQAEAQRGGFAGESSVIPLGVDRKVYYPRGLRKMRESQIANALHKRGLDENAFMVGVVAKNQGRKRLDLAVQYFAEWMKSYDVRDAVMWLHVGAVMSNGYNLLQLCDYYGISSRLIYPEIHPVLGVREDAMAGVYSMFSVGLNTSLGEGWCFPIMEQMACGVPCIVPQWSALGEWPEDAVMQVPCTATEVHPGPNTIGGVMDREGCIQALRSLYENDNLRRMYSTRGLALVSRPEFTWERIGQQYNEVLETVLCNETRLSVVSNEVPA